jgi:fibronectin type 3 domain-containing protein
VNPKPLTETRFEDARMEFGVERCFQVRTRETIGTFVIESAGSPMTCVTPVDTFAPAAPQKLFGVSSEGTVNLLWDPNSEADLAGYLVLRGEGAGEKLQQLTKAPITETTYRDTTVQAGTTYVYVVVAVDKAGNVSAQSNRSPN